MENTRENFSREGRVPNALKLRYAPDLNHAPVEFSQEESSLAGATTSLWSDIQRQGLESHVAELEVLGYAIIPPEKVAPPGFADELLDAVLRVYERRHGRTIDVKNTRAFDGPASSMGIHLAYLLFEDPAFQQAVLNPVVLTLADYMLGKNCILKNCLSLLKGPGGPDLSVHCDNGRISSPFPPHELTCNFTWALTDYTADNGALFVVPGSHKQYRHPKPGEGLEDKVIIEAPAGSLIAWTGRTWHGAVARKAPGIRVNLITAMCRSYIRPQEPYREDVDQELLDRCDPRLATLLGQHINLGWREEGPQGSVRPSGRHVYD
jgi:ectoine hydroxylase-related dioxygenase (phytanoyl-CoA dioxygenase family)